MAVCCDCCVLSGRERPLQQTDHSNGGSLVPLDLLSHGKLYHVMRYILFLNGHYLIRCLYMSSEVLITLELYIMVLQLMTSCSLVYSYHSSRETYCMCL